MGGFSCNLIRNRRNQAILGDDRSCSRIEHQEIARTVRVLCFTWLKGTLTERRCVLISEDSRDGNACKVADTRAKNT